jgi:hypothetical protein
MATGQGETQSQTFASRKRGTNERDYAYTRAARAHFSLRLANEETGGEPLMDIVGRRDQGSQSARMSHFLETYGGV